MDEESKYTTNIFIVCICRILQGSLRGGQRSLRELGKLPAATLSCRGATEGECANNNVTSHITFAQAPSVFASQIHLPLGGRLTFVCAQSLPCLITFSPCVRTAYCKAPLCKGSSAKGGEGLFFYGSVDNVREANLASCLRQRWTHAPYHCFWFVQPFTCGGARLFFYGQSRTPVPTMYNNIFRNPLYAVGCRYFTGCRGRQPLPI